MSSGTPPSPFFSGINFNPLFFQKVIVQYLTETIANTKYLMLSGLNYMTGNLGIKRAAAVELDVNGKAYINNSITGLPAVGVYGGSATKLILFQGSAVDTPVALGVDGSSLWYGSYSNGNHIFFTGTTERMRITSAGNVGIGTTSTNSSMLNLYGITQLQSRINLTGQEFYAPSNTSTDGIALLLGLNRTNLRCLTIADTAKLTQNTTNSSIVLSPDGSVSAVATDGNTVLPLVLNGSMSIISGGNVAVGLANPNGKLHLHNGGTGQEVMIRLTDSGTGITATDGCAFYKSINNDLLLNNFENNKIIFATNNINRASIQSTGEFYVENSLIVGNANINPNVQLGTTTNNIGVATTATAFSSSAAVGDMVIRTTGKLLLQSGNGNCAMCINTNNYIQIGTGSIIPTFPITLNSTQTTNQPMTAIYSAAINSGFNTMMSGSINPSISIGILSNTAFSVGFYIYSDKRIKKDFEPINNSLETIEKINLTSFRYIDWKQKGNIKNYGIIAQEVEEIIPEVINKHQDFIPNIYKNANSYDGISNIYIEIDDISIGDKIKIYDDKNKEHIKEVIDINEDYITIDSPIEDYEEDSPLFIYGKEIPDVKNVNYEALFIINMRATQELYKRVKALEKYFNIVY
jgi:hypothetical protein